MATTICSCILGPRPNPVNDVEPLSAAEYDRLSQEARSALPLQDGTSTGYVDPYKHDKPEPIERDHAGVRFLVDILNACIEAN